MSMLLRKYGRISKVGRFLTPRLLMLTAQVLRLQEESATLGTQKCGGIILVPHLDMVLQNWNFLFYTL
jgi:hypothetical protein